jgi:hypothetical protein
LHCIVLGEEFPHPSPNPDAFLTISFSSMRILIL